MFLKAMLKRKNNKKAFTLIELIVVIAIIGVLVAILVPTMNGFVDDAKEATCLANARTGYSVAVAELNFNELRTGTAHIDYTAANAMDNFVESQMTDINGSFTIVNTATTVTSVTYTDEDGNSAQYPPS